MKYQYLFTILQIYNDLYELKVNKFRKSRFFGHIDITNYFIINYNNKTTG